MATQHIVKEGENLSMIARRFGVSISQITGYRSGDPDKIYPGEKLTIGETPSKLGGLGGTLETGGGVDVTGKRELPSFQAGNLSIFKSLLKQVSERYARSAGLAGMESTMGRLGVEPEQISGKGLKGIVDFVKGQVTPGISDIYKSTIDLLESSRTSAERQLNILISQNALTQLSDSQLAKLSNMSGMDYEYLMGIKKAQEAKAKEPKSFAYVEEGGRKIRLGFDEMGSIVSRTDIGAVSAKTFSWANMTPSAKQDIVAWLTTQEGYDLSWLKKLDEDPNFATFIVSKYYQQLSEW